MNDKMELTCDECGSEYYSDTSKIARLCPHCAHFLYGYDNCNHYFNNGRCINCFWNGNIADQLKKVSSRHNKTNDALSRNMQDEAVKIAYERLGYPLVDYLADKIRRNKWSYMGLEMIIDTVRDLPVDEIEGYLSRLE